LVEHLSGGVGSIFVVGGTQERAVGQRIRAQIAQRGIPAREALALPVEEIAALLAKCTAYVGNDTGVLNMAAAVRTPAWGLFGASPPLRHSHYIHCLTPPQGRTGMEALTPEYVAAELSRSGVLQ